MPLFLSEMIDELDLGARFLTRLSQGDRRRLRDSGRTITARRGQPIFRQGEPHEGIYIIERGQVRVYYTAPSGREITLAYWTAGHFIGGPEIAGGGRHVWSGVAVDDAVVTAVSGGTMRQLLASMPELALAMIDGLIAKGRCYSSMAQMLGTRSVIERLAQFLVNLAALRGREDGHAVVIDFRISHDQVGAMVGSTRQWVTMMLGRFQRKGILTAKDGVIRIHRLDLLEEMLFQR
jgi:CRP-like cAMP-binding protein